MSAEFIGIVGFTTAFVSILVKAIGLPDQIRKNHKRKSTQGLSVPFFLLSVLAYGLWTVYGILKKDPVLIFGQGFGMITMAIIAYQIWIYKGNKP
jgi:uncharacterized protein with PQ loop repeat